MGKRKHVIGIVAASAVFIALSIGVGIDQAQGTPDDLAKFISPPPIPKPSSQSRSLDGLTDEQKRALLSSSLPGPRRTAADKAVDAPQAVTDPVKARALVSSTPSAGKNLNETPFEKSDRKVRVVSGVETPDGKAPYLGATRPAPELTAHKTVKSVEETRRYLPRPAPASSFVPPSPRMQIDAVLPKTPERDKGVLPGDVISTAFPLAIPALIAGSTVGYADDYDETCPLLAPGSPDVVFSYTPKKIEAFSIILCASSYDTKVYVYQDFATPGSPYACNEDWCGVDGWRSFIDCITVFPGHTYYIVVDGFGGGSGDFVLELRDCQLGERVDNAIPIPALPFFDSRDTGPFFNDYDEICPYAGSGSPDVVFSYTPFEDQRIQIDLCNSAYDTKVYVYTAQPTPGFPYQCNDDACGVDGFRSHIPCFHVSGGQTYYIVVDGFGGQAGTYDLQVSECCDGLAGCTAVSYPEGEICGQNPDVINGGCNSSPFVYSLIAPEQSVCGTGWFDLSARDTDWYVASLHAGDSVTWCVRANFTYMAAIILYDESQCGTPTIVSSAESDECTELCLSLKVPTDAQYAFFVAPSFNSPELNCSDGPWEYNADLHEICDPITPQLGTVFEQEECLFDPLLDVVNGGCNYSPYMYSPLVPKVPVWGYGSWDGSSRDTDWYRLAYPLQDGDSVTWRVTANFGFTAMIIDLRYGCGALTSPVFAYGGPCDTVSVGLRIDTAGEYAFFVAPQFAGVPYLCADGPWIYEAVLFRDAACYWTGCLPGGTPEGETCLETLNDLYNGGCNVNPPAFQPINSGDHICGQAWGRTDLGWRDTDWYEKVVYPGETATWCVRAEFDVELYLVDITPGCGAYTVIDLAGGPACQWVTLSYTALVKTDVAFFVAPSFYAEIPCASGPWEYDAYLDPGPTCIPPECPVSQVYERDGCIEDQDLFNAGCGSSPPRYTDIPIGATGCGQVYFAPPWIDYDWYRCQLTTGDVVRYTVYPTFPIEAAALDVTTGCGSASLVAIGYGPACSPLVLSFTAASTGDYAFVVAPDASVSPPMPCRHGPWTYSINISACACDCAHDPQCDGVTDIFDVTQAVNVAFRNEPALVDPDAACPWEMTDVNCDGVTDIFDVTKFVNVAFRNADPATEFCNPCP